MLWVLVLLERYLSVQRFWVVFIEEMFFMVGFVDVIVCASVQVIWGWQFRSLECLLYLEECNRPGWV